MIDYYCGIVMKILAIIQGTYISLLIYKCTIISHTMPCDFKKELFRGISSSFCNSLCQFLIINCFFFITFSLNWFIDSIILTT